MFYREIILSSLFDTVTIFSKLKALSLLAMTSLACVKKFKHFMFPYVLIKRASFKWGSGPDTSDN